MAISAVMVVKMAAFKVDQNSTKKTAKKEASEQQNYMAEGMAIGMGLGTAIGTFLGEDKLAVGVSIGMLLEHGHRHVD